MGISTDGILCYGIDFGDTNPLPEEEDDEKDDEYHLAVLYFPELAVLRPTDDYSDATKYAYHNWWDAKREALKLVPVEIVKHCSYDEPMYILAVKASHHFNYRGYPKNLGQAIIPNVEWVGTLHEALDKMGVEHGDVAEPAWLLASMYG